MDAFAKAIKKWEAYRQAVEQHNAVISSQVDFCKERRGGNGTELEPVSPTL